MSTNTDNMLKNFKAAKEAVNKLDHKGNQSLFFHLINKNQVPTYAGIEVHNYHGVKGPNDTLNINAYPRGAEGVSCTHMYTSKSGQIFILLAQKEAHIQKHIDLLYPVGGYSKPHHLTGHDPHFIPMDAETKDLIQEASIGNKIVNTDISAKTTSSEISYKKLYAHEAISDLIVYFYMKNLNKDPSGKFPINLKYLLDMRAVLSRNGVKPDCDLNFWETGARETLEETCLNVQKLPKEMVHHLSQNNTLAHTNAAHIHTNRANLVYNWGIRDSAPAVTPGSDIGKLIWIPVDEIITPKPLQEVFVTILNQDKCRSTYQGKPILLEYGRSVIPEAIAWIRDMQVANLTKSTKGNVRFESRQAFLNFLSDEHGVEFTVPAVETGLDAHEVHLNLVNLAEIVGNRKYSTMNSHDFATMIRPTGSQPNC